MPPTGGGRGAGADGWAKRPSGQIRSSVSPSPGKRVPHSWSCGRRGRRERGRWEL